MPKFFRRNQRFILIGILLLALFYAFSFFLVKGEGLNRFDFDMSVRIQNNVPVRIDPYLSILSLIGSFEGMVVLLIALLLLIRKAHSFLILGVFAFMHVVEIIGKAFLDHPGTPFMFHRYAFDFVFPTGYVQPGGSYPSGHAMRAAFLVVLCFKLVFESKMKPGTKIALLCAISLLAAVILISRVSLGEHWTSDVIGGSLLGAGFAYLSIILL